MEQKRFVNVTDIEVVKMYYKGMGHTPSEINTKINCLTSQELNSLRRRIY